MNSTKRMAFIILILLHIIRWSKVSASCEAESNQLMNWYLPRKLLAYSSSSSSPTIHSLETGHEAAWRSVDTSLKQAPTSKSNPIQNK